MDEFKRLVTDAEIQFARREIMRFKGLIEQDKSNRDAYNGLVTYSIQLGLYHEATQVFEKASKEFPKESYFYIQLGDIYYSAGRDESAITAFEMALRISSDQDTFAPKLTELYFKHKKYKKIVQFFAYRDDVLRHLFQRAKDDEEDREVIFKAFCTVLEEQPSCEHLYKYILELLDDQKEWIAIAQNTFRWVISHNIDCQPAFKALYDLALKTNVYQETLDEFFKTLKMMPSHEVAHHYLRLLLSHTQSHSESVKVFSQLITVAPQVKAFYLSLAKAYREVNKNRDAIETLKKALRYCGNDDDVLVMLTELYIKQGKLDYALKFAERSRQNIKKPQKLMRLQYQIYLKMNRKQVALDFYKQTIQLYPEEKMNYESIYDVCCEVGDFLTAADIVMGDNEAIEVLLDQVKQSEGFSNAMGVCERLLFRFPKNTKLYQGAIEVAMEESYVHEAMSWMYRLVEQDLTNTDVLQEAYDLALHLKLDYDVLYLYQRSQYLNLQLQGPIEQVCLKLGAYVVAAEAVSRKVDHFHFIYQKAVSQDNIYAGIEVLEKSLNHYPTDVLTMTHLVKHYQDFNEYEKARNLCEKLSPGFNAPEQYHEWALLEYKLGENEKAKSILDQGIQKSSDDLTLALLLGEIIIEQEDVEDAVQTCRELQQKFPQEAKFALWLGQLCEKQGRSNLAADMYYLSISLDPLQVEIYRKLIQLSKGGLKQDRVVDICQKAIGRFSKELAFYLELGEVYRERKEYARAIDLYRDALKISPGNKLCYANLFQLYCDIQDYSNALRICPEEREDFLNLYHMCFQNKNKVMAVETLKKAVRFFPIDFELHQKLASLFYRMKQWLNAEEVFLKMLEIAPNHRQTYLNLFALRCQLEHYEDAIDVYAKAYRRWSKDEEFPLKMAAVHYKLKHYDQAIDNYKRAIKINDTHKSVFQKLGAVYEKLSRCNDASALYKEAILRFPYEIDFYRKRAFLLEEMEDYSESVRVLRQAIHQNDIHIDLYTQLGAIYKKTGRYKDCVQCFEDAIRLDENNEQRYVDLGSIYVHFEKEIEALDLFKGIVRRWPYNTMAYNHLFEVYHSRKKYDYAEEYYRELISLDEDSLEDSNPWLYLYLFNIFYIQKKFMDAIHLLENCLIRFPRNTDLLKRLAALYYKLGKMSEAIVYFQKCLDINPEDKVVYKYLFNIFFKAKRFNEAMEFYQKALVLWPSARQEFAFLYKLCTKIELDEDAFKQVTAILDDYHNEKNYAVL